MKGGDAWCCFSSEQSNFRGRLSYSVAGLFDYTRYEKKPLCWCCAGSILSREAVFRISYYWDLNNFSDIQHLLFYFSLCACDILLWNNSAFHFCQTFHLNWSKCKSNARLYREFTGTSGIPSTFSVPKGAWNGHYRSIFINSFPYTIT